jgi:predicted small secreted protein
MSRLMRTAVLAAAVPLAAMGLAGCSTLNAVRSDVSAFGDWPAGRAPGRYVIERLPSQQTARETPVLEAAARASLERAGFQPVADPAQAQVVVQVGGRITEVLRAYHDPFWGGRFGMGGFYGRGIGLGVGFGAPLYGSPTYDREVSLLLRDRASGKVLYETKASSYGATPGDESVLGAMFDAALEGFPQAQPGPRRVAVEIGGGTALGSSRVVSPAPAASAPR